MNANEIVKPHTVDNKTKKYADIKKEMIERGECTILVLRVDGILYACEGSHRLTIAEEIGMDVNVIIDSNDCLKTDLNTECFYCETIDEMKEYIVR